MRYHILGTLKRACCPLLDSPAHCSLLRFHGLCALTKPLVWSYWLDFGYFGGCAVRTTFRKCERRSGGLLCNLFLCLPPEVKPRVAWHCVIRQERHL